MLGLAHAIRVEEKENGIRTCVIMPGLVETEILERRPVKPTAEMLAKALQPVDVAEAVLAVAQFPPRAVVPEMMIVPTRAQQVGKLPTIGFLGGQTPSTAGQWLAAFEQRLRELGWIEGRNVAIEVRWAEGRSERAAEIAAEFARLKVDVIVTSGPAVFAAKQATSVIPIVFATVADPLSTGLVASLARPGGNVTGLSLTSPDLAGKRLELLHEAVPGLRQLAIMANADYPPSMQELEEVETAARALGIETITLKIREAANIASAFESLKGRAQALYVVGEPLTSANRVRINSFALAARLPTMVLGREILETGGLISYGPNFPSLYRRAGDYVDKILRGGKPAEIPVEQPTKFDLVINLTTAKALGLDVLPTLLARADEVVE